MTHRQLKTGYLAITWLHIYAVAYYFNYLFFHNRDVGQIFRRATRPGR